MFRKGPSMYSERREDSQDFKDEKLRSAINFLLSSGSVGVEKPSVKLIQCDPDVDIVINKQGGICTKCNVMFKSKVALDNHIEMCYDGSSKINNNDFGKGLVLSVVGNRCKLDRSNKSHKPLKLVIVSDK